MSDSKRLVLLAAFIMSLTSQMVEAREIYSMTCEGKGVFYDSMDNKVTVMLIKDGIMSHASMPAARVEHIDGYVAVDVVTANTTIIFRFKEKPVKGADNNEALITLPNTGGNPLKIALSDFH